MTTVLLFPGQSSRYPDMIERIVRTDPPSAAILAEASAILGRDLATHFRSDNHDVFARNRDVQVGVFLANHLHLRALEAAGVDAEWSLGLSLGEYNHLVHIGALDFEAALALVAARGELYDGAQGGLMVSVFPIDAATVESTIARLGLGARVGIGLYNSPRQQVLSGERAAVERVVSALVDDSLIEAVPIEPRIPMHADVFAAYGERLAAVLDRTPFARPRLPYVPNSRGAVLLQPSVADIRTCLTEHVSRPVRWQASIESIAAAVPAPRFVEVGPRQVLSNLFGRGWRPGTCVSTDVEGRSVRATAEELCDAHR